MTDLATILPLAAEGWRLFPVRKAGKSPAIDSWPSRATSDEARLREWEAEYPNCNWAVATGAGSDVFVVDCDGEAGLGWLQERTREYGDTFANTRSVQTARGLHLYFKWPGNGTVLRNSAGKVAGGIDVRGTNGFAIVPPSLHASGTRYEWTSFTAVQTAPAWLLEAVTTASREIVAIPNRTNGNGSARILSGTRNVTLTSLAGSMRRKGASPAAIAAALQVENQQCDPPLDGNEVATIAESVSQYEPAPTAVSLLCAKSGEPRAIVENVLILLRQSPEWEGVIAYDEFAERIILRKAAPGVAADSRTFPSPWTDRDDTLTTAWMQRAGVMVTSTNVVAQAISAVAHENKFHPLCDYLNGLTWDGIERADHWLTECFGAEDTEYVRAISRRWLISACARAFSPGCQVDHSLLLIGQQGLRKSSGLRALVPDPTWFADSLSTLGSRDSRMEVAGKWICELSELSALRRAEIESIKSFLTERCDHYRPPYARHAIDVPRSCVFAATTNIEDALLDSENRRFWPAHVGKVDVTAIEEYRAQLWAEAVAYFKRGDVWWLETAGLTAFAQVEQAACHEAGPRDDLLSEWITEPERNVDLSQSESWFGSTRNRINVTDALVHGLKIPRAQIKPGDHKEIARYLRFQGYKPTQERSGANRGRRYWIAPKEEKDER